MPKTLLLINLGSPESPQPKDVAVYLKQFLMDPYVIDIPKPLRAILVHALIVPKRAVKSGEAYAKIWSPQGSPLVHHTRTFAGKVAEELGSEWQVRWGMRYGQPSIESALKDLPNQPLYVVPLYPQYAESSTQTAIDEVKRHLKGRPAKFINDFFDQPEFVQAQAQQIQTHVDRFKPDHLLLSFHGLPEHHMTKLYPDHCFKTADCCDQISEKNRLCYRAQCFHTVRSLKGALNFPENQIAVGFQSRLGARPWIKPYTDHVIEELAGKGAKRVMVSCPSFVADCLETLEEIQMRLKEQFTNLGGQELELIPALNSSDLWCKEFSKWVRRTLVSP